MADGVPETQPVRQGADPFPGVELGAAVDRQKNLEEWGSGLDLFGCTILQPLAALSRNGLFESGSGGLLCRLWLQSPSADMRYSRLRTTSQ